MKYYDDMLLSIQNQPQTIIDSNAVSYTINFTDTIFGIHCGSAFVPTSSSSCGGRVCTSTFTIMSSSECHPSTDISVTVFATNGLGNGPSSDPTLISKIIPVIILSSHKSLQYISRFIIVQMG